MGKEILTFGNIEIEKNKIYHHKTPIFKLDPNHTGLAVISLYSAL